MEQEKNRFFIFENDVPYSLEEIKTKLFPLINFDLAAALAKTDWQVTRANDPTSQKPITPEVLQERQNARNKAIESEIAINNANSVEELKQIYVQYFC
jgi:hypothetical protein